MTVAKKGYWGGNLQLIWQAPVNMVIDVFNYENFIEDYKETEMIINEAKS